MRDILVIRFGALGDLCVLGWALARLADGHPDATVRITLVTKAAFAPLMSSLRGVDEVIGLEDTSLGGVRRLATRLRSREWDTVLDAHNSLRSHLLSGLMGRRPDRRLGKDTLARLGFMSFGQHHRRLEQSMLDRFNTLTSESGPSGQTLVTQPPLIHFRTKPATEPNSPTAPIVGLAPGAQWDTKRWPAENFAELLQLLKAANSAMVRIYLGPREAHWFPESDLARVAAQENGVEIVRLPDLVAVARNLATVNVLVTNDSGLLHLAETVGTRVLAFFGPTVRQFGYFPLAHGSRVLERSESCRPCSRNGKRPCRRGDLACLRGILPTQALAALQDMLAKDVS